MILSLEVEARCLPSIMSTLTTVIGSISTTAMAKYSSKATYLIGVSQ